MKRFPLRATAASLAVFAALSVVAPAADTGDAMKKPAAPAAPTFLKITDVVDVRKVLPAPPAAGSLAASAELNTVLQAQGWRTPEQAAWAKTVDKNDLFELFGAQGPLGANFTAEKFPRLVALMKSAYDDVRPAVDATKSLYARPRPFKADARVQPIIEQPTSDSYPSGHSFGSHLRAAVLAEVFPAQAEALRALAFRVAWGRVLAGVHYPSDLEGGRLLAEACIAELRKSAAFRAAVEKCRAEGEAAPRKKAA